jgi:transcriptional repressor NrdR
VVVGRGEGVKCPYCGFPESRVLDSRPTEDGAVIRRRRECERCQRRFTTYEKVDELPLVVVKKDGRREKFDRQKVLTGLLKACEKRPVGYAAIEHLVETLEMELQSSAEKEISSIRIGERVMAKLLQMDDVAYVRFASVYRQFKDVSQFVEEIKTLITDPADRRGKT